MLSAGLRQKRSERSAECDQIDLDQERSAQRRNGGHFMQNLRAVWAFCIFQTSGFCVNVNIPFFTTPLFMFMFIQYSYTSSVVKLRTLYGLSCALMLPLEIQKISRDV